MGEEYYTQNYDNRFNTHYVTYIFTFIISAGNKITPPSSVKVINKKQKLYRDTYVEFNKYRKLVDK